MIAGIRHEGRLQQAIWSRNRPMLPSAYYPATYHSPSWRRHTRSAFQSSSNQRYAQSQETPTLRGADHSPLRENATAGKGEC